MWDASLSLAFFLRSDRVKKKKVWFFGLSGSKYLTALINDCLVEKRSNLYYICRKRTNSCIGCPKNAGLLTEVSFLLLCGKIGVKAADDLQAFFVTSCLNDDEVFFLRGTNRLNDRNANVPDLPSHPGFGQSCRQISIYLGGFVRYISFHSPEVAI